MSSEWRLGSEGLSLKLQGREFLWIKNSGRARYWGSEAVAGEEYDSKVTVTAATAESPGGAGVREMRVKWFVSPYSTNLPSGEPSLTVPVSSVLKLKSAFNDWADEQPQGKPNVQATLPIVDLGEGANVETGLLGRVTPNSRSNASGAERLQTLRESVGGELRTRSKTISFRERLSGIRGTADGEDATEGDDLTRVRSHSVQPRAMSTGVVRKVKAPELDGSTMDNCAASVSYTHLRAHET